MTGKGPKGNYYRKILRVQPHNLIALWRLNDNGAYALDSTKESGIGTAESNTGTWGVKPTNFIEGADGHPAAYFDGSTSYLDVYSSAFNTDFDADNGSIIAWCKVHAKGTWADGTVRKIIHLGEDANNYVAIQKTVTANTIGFYMDNASTLETTTSTALGGTLDWFSVGYTWDISGDAIKAYINGEQVGSTATSFGTWTTPTLASTLANIGSASTTAATVWYGWLQNVAIWKGTLTAAEMKYLGKMWE